MLSIKNPNLVIKILILVLTAAVSIVFAASIIPDMAFVRNSMESVEESRGTVMEFSAATLSTSLAISALPDDFATPLADSLADMNIYFVGILVVLFLEKILLQSGIRLAFAVMIPLACFLGILAICVKRNLLKSLAIRLGVLALAVAFVVPCSTYVTGLVADELLTYVDETIVETNDGAGKLQEAMEDGGGDKTVFEKLSDLFQTAIHSVSDMMTYFQNTIRRCMNSIAILIVTNLLMPLLTFFVLKWILKETFHIAIPTPPLHRARKDHDGPSDPGHGPDPGRGHDLELAAAEEGAYEG